MSRRPLDRPALQALVLAAAAGLFGLVVNAAREDGLDLTRPVLAASGASDAATCGLPAGQVVEIPLEEARSLHAQQAIFVDARQASAYAVGHVEGALHLPSRGECPEGPELIDRLVQLPTVVVYDDGGACALAHHLGERLVAEGVADVRVMRGGFSGWLAAGEAAQSGQCAACDELVEQTR